MIEKLFREKLESYAPADGLEQEHALVELMQQYVLGGLSRAGLFRDALFHGGTCLRIVHATRRFSEDLDFMCKREDAAFRWRPYLESVRDMGHREGLQIEIQDRSETRDVVKKGFVKTGSVGSLVLVDLPYHRDKRKKIRIKVEIDTNPPAGSGFESAFLSFPFLAPITVQTLESGFGTKLHALLCRSYIKGRDWYDFLWYVDRGISPDLALLQNAIAQQGPWAGKRRRVTATWFADELGKKIDAIDWTIAREDVLRFVPSTDQQGVEHWSRELFRFYLNKLKHTLGAPSAGG